MLQAYAGGVNENAPLSSLFSFGSSDEPVAAPAKATPAAKRKPPVAIKPADVPAKKATAD